jgi:protein arginine kinase activator
MTPEPRRCDACGRNPAEMTVEDVSKSGRSIELHLCRQCASDRGLVVTTAEQPPVSVVLDERTEPSRDADALLVCTHCGLSYAEFKKTLRLGCSECYTSFAERLNPTIRRIHGALRHTGRVPQSDGDAPREFEIQRLRRTLSKAIEQEDYERAAAVRDEIRQAGGEVDAAKPEGTE